MAVRQPKVGEPATADEAVDALYLEDGRLWSCFAIAALRNWQDANIEGIEVTSSTGLRTAAVVLVALGLILLAVGHTSLRVGMNTRRQQPVFTNASPISSSRFFTHAGRGA
jgi:hypothetical protein